MLRAEELQPWVLAPDRAWTVSDVVRRRATRLRTRVAPVSSAADLRGGRLLIYFPDGNLSDGAAEAQSDGLFDVENTPPWDIWVAFGVDPDHEEVDRRAYLVAWVPEPLLALADRGIRVNPEECICWLDEVRSGARDELRAFLR